jgi:hypothetical protein
VAYIFVLSQSSEFDMSMIGGSKPSVALFAKLYLIEEPPTRKAGLDPGCTFTKDGAKPPLMIQEPSAFWVGPGVAGPVQSPELKCKF